MRISPALARKLFIGAGLYGIAVLAPLYFLEDTFSRMFPPAFSHPEQFYGFVGVALAWQFAFLVIARDAVRHRPLMLPAVAEKLLSSGSVFVLCALGRTPAQALPLAVIDCLLGLAFLACFVSLKDASS